MGNLQLLGRNEWPRFALFLPAVSLDQKIRGNAKALMARKTFLGEKMSARKLPFSVFIFLLGRYKKLSNNY